MQAEINFFMVAAGSSSLFMQGQLEKRHQNVGDPSLGTRLQLQQGTLSCLVKFSVLQKGDSTIDKQEALPQLRCLFQGRPTLHLVVNAIELLLFEWLQRLLLCSLACMILVQVSVCTRFSC